MAVKTNRVTVGTSLVELTAGDRNPSSIAIKVLSGSTIYFGGPDVSTSNGWAVAVGESVSIDLEVGETVHVVTTTGTAEVQTMRGGA